MRRGDTVWGVSSRHGVDPAALERLNHLSDLRTLPVGLRLVLPARGESADDPLRSVRRSLAEALWTLRQARFEEALEAAALGRRAREGLPTDAESSALGAQLDLVSANAELAFGRREAALEHLASALRLEPGLTLDASTTSPKVLDLLAEAREGLREHGGATP
jgi:LysM repeat protein